MSVKCEEPIDELTVQVWLLYPHPNFSYCTLFVRGTELRTDRRTIRLLDAPGGPFRPGKKNMHIEKKIGTEVTIHVKFENLKRGRSTYLTLEKARDCVRTIFRN